jgi:hypothetical protein
MANDEKLNSILVAAKIWQLIYLAIAYTTNIIMASIEPMYYTTNLENN